MSAAEIALRDQQLEEKIGEMQAQIKRVEKSERRAQEVDELEEQCKDCEAIMEMMRMEFRGLGPDDKLKFREKLKKHKTDLKTLRSDLEWLKENNTRKELMGDRKEGMQDLDMETSGGMMTYGKELQKQSLESLQRTVGVVGDTQTVARETAVKIAQQTDQIKKMYDELYEIDDMLKRSRKIIARMLRKTASSKTVWILVFCVIVGIALIIYFKVKV